MNRLVFATHNANKLKEVRELLSSSFEILSLDDIGFNDDIIEDKPTIIENSIKKAELIKIKTGYDCFADDTGLEVEALYGRPGVCSARYAGEHATAEENMHKLLSEMEGQKNRNVCFRTVISLILNGKEYSFEGKVKGEILYQKTGSDGFGYDPIFKPTGFDQSFAQMTMKQKNEISHRGVAVKKLIHFLSQRS